MATLKVSLLLLSLLGLLSLAYCMSVVGPDMGSHDDEGPTDMDGGEEDILDGVDFIDGAEEIEDSLDYSDAQERRKRQSDCDLAPPIMEVRNSFLRITIRNASNLRDTDTTTRSDPYAEVRALRVNGVASTFRTNVIRNNHFPVWRQSFTPGFSSSGWSYLSIRVLDSDNDNDEVVMDRVNFIVEPGVHTDVCHCTDNQRRRCLCLDYTLTVDRDRCSPNPCQNGGTCSNRYLGFRCRCRNTYTGSRCQFRRGRLFVRARTGTNLPDEDPGSNRSDPYMEVVARDRSGNTRRRVTRTDSNDLSPEWNQLLEFGRDDWRSFTIRVLDDDVQTSDNVLCGPRTYNLPGYLSRRNQRLSCTRGSVTFDYFFGTDPNAPVIGPPGPPGERGPSGRK